MKEFEKISKIELNSATSNGYTFTDEEREIIRRNNKNNLGSITANLSNNAGKYINPNLTDMYGLNVSEEEHEEIVHKTVGRVIEKLDQELEM